jgi:hypothetical protein
MTPVQRAIARQCQLYCVGTAKSGTHSIASMFVKSIKAKHEPQAEELIKRIIAANLGEISTEQMSQWIKTRDSFYSLDIDSSQLNVFILNALQTNFPAARFLLTIRDCYSWLDSIFDHCLTRPASRAWLKMRDFRFATCPFIHSAEERILKKHGLYTLDGYLSYWAKHNKQVLDTVPSHKLLIVRTDQITKSVDRIAQFAGLSTKMVSLSDSHAFKSYKHYNLVSRIDRDYLQYKVHLHCGNIMNHFFPEITIMPRKP